MKLCKEKVLSSAHPDRVTELCSGIKCVSAEMNFKLVLMDLSSVSEAAVPGY